MYITNMNLQSFLSISWQYFKPKMLSGFQGYKC